MTNTAFALSGAANAAPPLVAALEMRANILDLTQQAEDAVLRPDDPGGWSHAQRAAMAARIARLNDDTALADHYGGAVDAAPMADPGWQGEDKRTRAALRFMDAMARDPRDMEAVDIARLLQAGIDDADIVRLSELNAFLAYQLRLVAGLRLLTGAA